MRQKDFQRSYEYFYDKVEKLYEIHLGVADKFALKRHLISVNCFSTIDDIFAETTNFLYSRGYVSKKINYYKEANKELEQDSLNMWLNFTS